jgi:serpin B
VSAGLTLAVLLAGCGAGASSGGSGKPDPGTATLVGKVEPLHPGSVTAGEVAADDTAFGFALFGRLCAAAPTSNVTLSPASAAQALGMLDAGSAGATRAAVSRLLHLPGWDQALVAALHDQSAALGKVAQVTVANHVFEQAGLRPTQTALDDLQTAYAASLRQVDFAAEPATTDLINHVISNDTDGMIPSLFDQPLDAGTRTVLADAILLNAKWQQPFPESKPAPFVTASGKTVSAPLMSNPDGSFASRTAAGWQSVVLPYVGNLQAVAILPPSTTSTNDAGTTASAANCATPSPATLSALTSGPSQSAEVSMPKLDLSQTLQLTSTLAAMGLPLSGDYSGLGSGDSQISEVVQKVVMKVDQQGTKAAAATGIAVATSIRVGGQTVTFDRPFFLLLEDTATHTPLFLTRVADPTQQ